MLQRIRESWHMTGHNLKVLIVFLLFLIVAALFFLVLLVRNWWGPIDVEVAKPGRALESQMQRLEEMGITSEPGDAMRYAQREVLSQHFAAVGGIELISSIKSLRIYGTVNLADGSSQDVVVAKKLGNRIRISTKNQTLEQVMVYTPEDSWMALRRMGALVSVQDLPPEQARSMSRFANVNSELFLAMHNSWEVEYLGQKDFNYKMAHVFEVKVDPGHLVRFFIDPTSYLEVGREDRIFHEDGELEIQRFVYSGHFDSNGLIIPGTMESYRNGEYRQTMRIQGAEANPGILDSSFDRPVALVTPSPS